MQNWLRCLGIVFLALGLLGGVSSPALAAPPPPGGLQVVARVEFHSRADLEQLAGRLDVWEVHSDKGYLIAALSTEQVTELVRSGHVVQVDSDRTLQYNRPLVPLPGQLSGIPGYPCYHTVEETFAAVQAMADAHPALATWEDIGDSWEKTQNAAAGYDMRVLRLTNSAIPGPKPALFIMAGIHAREYAPPEVTLNFAESLLERYGTDPDVTWMLDYQEIHLIFASNPDGRKRAETGASWRKNTNNNYCANTTSRGADLNRNYSFYWAGCGNESCSSSDPCDDTYRGPSAGSEPETQAVQNYLLTHFPDQRGSLMTDTVPITATGVFFDLHSYSELVLWPWGFGYTVAPNGTELQTLGRKLAYFNHYDPMQSSGLYPTDGSTDDFAYGNLGLAAYTIEMGTTFFQPCSSFESTVLPDNLQSLEYAARVVRAPYMLPGGPDALQVQVSSILAVPGTLVTLTATLDDTRYAGGEAVQNIAAAEFTIDTPPWSTAPVPTAYPLAAVDGQFNTTREAVQATVDVSSLAPGRHTLFVHGRDASGDWGPVSAVFLYVMVPESAGHLVGRVYAAGSNQPLSATVSAGLFQTTSDPATGFYDLAVISGTYTLQAVANAEGYRSMAITNVVVGTGETVTRDLALAPYCTAYLETAENGMNGWTAQSPWALTTESYHSSGHSWTDSPGGQYADSRDVTLTSPVVDLSKYQNVSLRFWHTYATESGWDYGYVEYLTANGTWETVAGYDGNSAPWTQVELPLPALDGQPNARIRFRFYSDTSRHYDGWHIDDIEIRGTGAGCVPEPPLRAPTADFTVTQPILVGQAVTFTSQVTGTEPYTYYWAFGDGDLSSLPNPIHTYPMTGTYTVTLIVYNPVGSDLKARAVTVEAPATTWPAIYFPIVLRGEGQ